MYRFLPKFIIVSFCLLSSVLFSQDYVAVWDLSLVANNTQISFNLKNRNGDVNYTWQEIGGSNASGSGTFNASPGNGLQLVTVAGLPANAKIRLSLESDFVQRIIHQTGIGSEKALIELEAWGTASWEYMYRHFRNCNNLQVYANDSPNLSSVTNMREMFRNCTAFTGVFTNLNAWNLSNVTDLRDMFHGSSFDQDISNWDVRNVVFMNNLFRNTPFNQNIGAWQTDNLANTAYMFRDTPFNQNINNWDVSGVTNMSGMFMDSDFNQDLSSWNVSNVTTMIYLFRNTDFNQDISSWNVANVTDMSYMFMGTPFNQNINGWNVGSVTNMRNMFYNSQFNSSLSNWNVSSVTNMVYMFRNCPFNQDISNWNVSSVTNMNNMFRDSDFNQPINNWDVSSVTQMPEMFRYSPFNQDISSWQLTSLVNASHMFANTPFNQDLSGWNVSNITNMIGMFRNSDFNQDISSWDVDQVLTLQNMFNASAFNQDIGAWTFNATANLSAMLTNCALDVCNYSKILKGFAKNPTMPNNLNLGAGNIDYDVSAEAYKQYLIGTKGWSIGDGGTNAVNCADFENYSTVWDLSLVDIKDQIIIAVKSSGTVDYTWEVVGGGAYGFGTIAAQNLLTEVSISGLPNSANLKLHLEPNNIDAIEHKTTGNSHPALLKLESWGDVVWEKVDQQFLDCIRLDVYTTKAPDLSQVTSLSQIFENCQALTGANGNFNNWDVSGINDLSSAFKNTQFNGNISSWNTSALTNASFVFESSSFNQNLNSWDLSNVTTTQGMFKASSFNQELSNWDVSNITDLSEMFTNSAYDKSLGAWTFNANATLNDFIANSNMSVCSYSESLKGWANNAGTPVLRTIDASGLEYDASVAGDRNTLTVTKLWTINNDAQSLSNCPFYLDNYATYWDLSLGVTNERIRFYLQSTGNVNYQWEEEGGTNATGSGTIAASAGLAMREVTGLPLNAKIRLFLEPDNIVRIRHNHNSSENALLAVEKWGGVTWSTFEDMFRECRNFDITAPDAPDLSAVTSMRNAFYQAFSFTGQSTDMDSWDVSNVTNMEGTFNNARVFNQDISSWVVSNVTTMRYMFSNARLFNQNINFWNVSNVQSTEAMFLNAYVFNQPLGNWILTNDTTARNMFNNAQDFNQNINNWGASLANVKDMYQMFYRAYDYNQPMNLWNVSSVTNMRNMFNRNYVFNQNLNSWNVSSVVDMTDMFRECYAFNQPVDNWDVSSVTSMRNMFNNARVFNESIFTVGNNVTDLLGMFENARRFNQDISSWDISSVNTVRNMFNRAYDFDQNIGSLNFKAGVDLTNFILNSGLGCENYSLSLQEWANNPALPDGLSVSIGANGIEYSPQVATLRQYLIDTKNWGISGDVESATNCLPVVKYYWDGDAGDGNWSSSYNWSGNVLPSNEDTIVFDHSVVAGSYTVTVDVNSEVSVLDIAANDIEVVINEGISLDYGEIENDGKISLRNSASLVPIDGRTGNVTGEFEVVRQKPVGQPLIYYNFWSSPVTNGNTSMLIDGRFIFRMEKGAGSSSSYYKYHSGAMEVGEGYTAIEVAEAKFTGTVNNGDIQVDIEKNDGPFNLLGNPYPSAINALDFVTENESALADGTLYLWNQVNANQGNSNQTTHDQNSQANFIAVNSAGTSVKYDRSVTLSSTDIASCQGFGVAAKENGTITFSNSQRNAANSNFKSSGNDELLNPERYWFTVDYNGFEEGMMVAFADNVTNDREFLFDAPALISNSSLSIASKSKDNYYAINSLDKRDVQKLPIYLCVPYKESANGNFVNIKLGALENIRPGLKVYFHDTKYNKSIEMKVRVPISLYIDESKLWDGRYELHFVDQRTSISYESSVNLEMVYVYDNKLYNRGINYGASVDILDLSGKIIKEVELTSDENYIELNLQSGIYILQATNSKEIQQFKFIVQ